MATTRTPRTRTHSRTHKPSVRPAHHWRRDAPASPPHEVAQSDLDAAVFDKVEAALPLDVAAKKDKEQQA